MKITSWQAVVLCLVMFSAFSAFNVVFHNKADTAHMIVDSGI